MNLPRTDLIDASLELAIASAAVANYCDHIEHNEIADVGTIRESAAVLRRIGLMLSTLADRDPVDLYAERLAAIELRNVGHNRESFDGPEAARTASTWRQLQLVQIEHDHAYHGDVVGLRKADQLHHYALHFAKLVGACAEAADGRLDRDDFLARRVPDMLLFGLKLSTVTSEKLEETPVRAVTGDARIRAVA